MLSHYTGLEVKDKECVLHIKTKIVVLFFLNSLPSEASKAPTPPALKSTPLKLTLNKKNLFDM